MAVISTKNRKTKRRAFSAGVGAKPQNHTPRPEQGERTARQHLPQNRYALPNLPVTALLYQHQSATTLKHTICRECMSQNLKVHDFKGSTKILPVFV